MSMTLVAAKTYVARIIGGAASSAALDMAGEAIIRAYQDWQAAKFWTFLLKDTSRPTYVTSCVCTASSGSLTPPSSGALDFVNVGQGVTVLSGTATLAAGTTVTAYTRNTDGTIATVTLSNAFGGTTATQTLIFSADIPLVKGTGEYNLPNDLNGTYTARLIDSTGTRAWLKFIDQRYWDKLTTDQTLQGIPEAYAIYNPASESGQSFGHKRMQIFKTPDASTYVVRVRYFRAFDTSATNIDIPDDYLYKFLDYARSLLLEAKRAQDDPAGYLRSTGDSFSQAQQNDEQPNDDDDNDARLKSPYESGDYRGPLVGNGEFDSF